jgi:hypothetical protein
MIRVDGPCFYVITADIVASRKHRDAALHAKKGLTALNARCRSVLAAAFTLYRGDEIQGALHSNADIIRLVRHLRFFMSALELRIGVGAGAIATGLEEKYAWQMDGSAFHYSRAALERIKNRRTAATFFLGEERHRHRWETISAFYSLIDTIQGRWTIKQWQAIDAYERAGTYAAASLELGISPQNVAKRCRTAAWGAVSGAERFLTAYLKEG